MGLGNSIWKSGFFFVYLDKWEEGRKICEKELRVNIIGCFWIISNLICI